MYFDAAKFPLVRVTRIVAAVVSVADRVPRNVSVAERSPVIVVPDDELSVDPRVAASKRIVEFDAGVPTPERVDSLVS